jgi:hypothetical protein
MGTTISLLHYIPCDYCGNKFAVICSSPILINHPLFKVSITKKQRRMLDIKSKAIPIGGLVKMSHIV